jgi:hypothetical protein
MVERSREIDDTQGQRRRHGPLRRREREWADPRRWLFGAIQAFEIVWKQRDRHLLDVMVAAGLSLPDGDEPIGSIFRLAMSGKATSILSIS